MARWIVVVLVGTIAACGGKDGMEGDADVGEPDVADASDLTDGVEDPVGDPELDGEVDPDAAGDPGEDPGDDAADDCVTSDVGSAPGDLTDACARMAICIDPGNPRDNAGSCLLISLLGDWQPAYGEWRQILTAEAATTLWGEVDANSSCIAAASDCDAAWQCLHGGTTSPTCTLPRPSIAAWPTGCDGGDVVYCINVDPTTTGGREITVACAGSTTCMSLGGVYAGCFTSDCTSVDADPVCRSDDIDQCVASGMHMVIDCGEMARGAGGVCAMVDDGAGGTVASCVPTGSTCDASSYTDHCSGDDLVRCELDHEYASDCTAIGTGWTCNSTSAECVPDVSSWTCTVTEGGECDCDDLLFCDITVGADVRLHCPDYGLRTCAEGGGEAACVP
jgi:hypothetical protein